MRIFLKSLLFLIMTLPLACSGCKEPKDDQLTTGGTPPKPRTYDWAKMADTAQSTLLQQHWSVGGRYFLHNNAGNAGFNYWWQAHGLDVFTDGYLRTRNPAYLRQVNDLMEGAKARNGDTYLNEFYDDMQWMALVNLRLHAATGEARFKAVARTLWEDIKTGWNTNQQGGIAWRKSQLDYKNTPANAPACILAARLYQLDKQPDDLAWAKKIYDWQKATLVEPATGLVWDGINRTGNGLIDKDWKFTYCQGVFIGAALEMYKATGQDGYLNDAVKTADNATNDVQLSPAGILKDEGGGDGGLFKGILVRYLTQLVKEGPVGASAKAKYLNFLKFNGQALADRGTRRPAYLFGTNWAVPPGGSVDSSTQMSGLMLLEALADLQKEKLIE